MIIYLSLLICIIGLILYLARPNPDINPKIAEVGRIMFWVGLLCFLLKDSEAIVNVIRR